MRNSYKDLPEPQPQPCPVRPEYVTAFRITKTLWNVSEQYHAGAINHAGFTSRNRALWDEAERAGVADEVKHQLRKAR
jgi:hypothetical protein